MDLKTLLIIIVSGRIAMAPAPEGVANATMESLYNIFFILSCKVVNLKKVYFFNGGLWRKNKFKSLNVMVLMSNFSSLEKN
jgi:hypothetical protein